MCTALQLYHVLHLVVQQFTASYTAVAPSRLFTFMNASKPGTSTVFSAVLVITSCVFLVDGCDGCSKPTHGQSSKRNTHVHEAHQITGYLR